MLPVYLILMAQSPDPVAAWLAPSPLDFERILDETSALCERAEAIDAAVARVQNAAAQSWSITSSKTPDALAVEPILLRDHRDAVQSLRASSERLERISEAPTVAPVVIGARGERVKQLLERTRLLVRRYAEMLAWHERYVRPALARLEGSPALSPRAGWPLPRVRASDDPLPRTAVIGIGGGLVCPDGLRADGSTVLLKGEIACYGESDCSCVPVPVAPGAVLGP